MHAMQQGRVWCDAYCAWDAAGASGSIDGSPKVARVAGCSVRASTSTTRGESVRCRGNDVMDAHEVARRRRAVRAMQECSACVLDKREGRWTHGARSHLVRTGGR